MANLVTTGSIKGQRRAQWKGRGKKEEKNGKQEILKNREKERKNRENPK